VSYGPEPGMRLLHLYADEHGNTRFATTEVALPVRDFAPPATPFNASDGQPATQYLLIRLPVGWVGESHTSPKRQILFCLSGGSLRITCSTGEAATIGAGSGVVMSDVIARATRAKSRRPSRSTASSFNSAEDLDRKSSMGCEHVNADRPAPRCPTAEGPLPIFPNTRFGCAP